ncbi:MAG: hypothetical protein WKG07_34100 [Hymenobacter sp.]
MELEPVTVEALIGFGQAEDGGYGISADLHVNLPGVGAAAGRDAGRPPPTASTPTRAPRGVMWRSA